MGISFCRILLEKVDRMELYKIYNPITATPFKYTEDYMEFEPCDALKPYIRCFWGTKKPFVQKVESEHITGIVTPDTCMDLMFTVDFTNNKIYNSFCGINERVFNTYNLNQERKTLFYFSIRFYAWGAAMFAEESMRDTKNVFLDAGCHFAGLKKAIEPALFDVVDIFQLIPKVETELLGYYNDKHENRTVLQAIHYILAHKGKLQVGELRRELYISERQLERLFREYVGVTPKSLASMIRYQYLWNDIVYNRQFDVLDSVCKYGYSDQAHMYHDFKKYHSMSIDQAKKYAIKNVGNLQEKSEMM